MDDADKSQRPPPIGPRPRFNLATLLLVMLLLCVMAAGAFYAVQGKALGIPPRVLLVVVTAAAPAILLVALKAGHALLHWLDRRAGR